MVKVRGLTRVAQGNSYRTPDKIIEELKQKYKDPEARESLENILYNKFRWSDK